MYPLWRKASEKSQAQQRIRKKLILTNLASELLVFDMFLDVPLTVVLPDELRATVVARIRPDTFVCVHVWNVVGLADERTAALFTLERLGGAGCVRPLVQLQVPLGGKVLVTDEAGERTQALVRAQVDVQRRPQHLHFLISKKSLKKFTN